MDAPCLGSQPAKGAHKPAGHLFTRHWTEHLSPLLSWLFGEAPSSNAADVIEGEPVHALVPKALYITGLESFCPLQCLVPLA